LAGFKEALLTQHRERYLALKRSVDEDLADMIAARRLDVERIVYGLRRSCEKRLEEGLAANRRYINLKKRRDEMELQNSFFERLENGVREKIEIFRRSPGYGDAMKALAEEALERLPAPSVAWVEKGDAVFLKPEGNFLEVRETLQDVWGGLVLTEGKEGGKIVDNTFRTRWKRLYPFFVVESGNVFAELWAGGKT
jgi:vacuolar-type H+-ATPase subunit E/Vma4